MKILKTSSGIEMGILGEKPRCPAPTLFVVAASRNNTLEDMNFNRCGHILMDEGWLNVAIDAPGHGEDVRPGEAKAGLSNWRTRLQQNENFVETYVRQISAALDYLIEEKYSDPGKIAIAGTSRGGFLALHVAAADPRFKAVAAFCPVTELPVLHELRVLENDPLTQSLAISHLAKNLTGREIWMCIGNHDQRVDTDRAYAAARKIVLANLEQEKPASVELHILASEGHGIGKTTAHADAAAWLSEKVPAN